VAPRTVFGIQRLRVRGEEGEGEEEH